MLQAGACVFVSEDWLSIAPESPLPSAGVLRLIRVEGDIAIISFRGDEWRVPLTFVEEC